MASYQQGEGTINKTYCQSGKAYWAKFSHVVVVQLYDVMLVNNISGADPTQRPIFTGFPESNALTNGWNGPLIKLGNLNNAAASIRIGIKQNSTFIGVWYQDFPTSDVYLNGQLIYISKS